MPVLFQFLTIPVTWKALLMSQCAMEAGLSDFHKMKVTVMKAFFRKCQLPEVNYRNYEYFENDSLIYCQNWVR